jgi:hypothetical protein
MKSIVNTHKLKLVTIAVFITAAMIAVTPIVTSTDAFAAQRESRSSAPADVSTFDMSGSSPFGPCDAKTLTDSPQGNSLGWRPDGSEDTFTIDDSCYIKSDSTVLINVKDGGANFEACNVDYASDFGFFEVFCSAPPDDGSELHYIIFVEDKDVVGMEAPTPEEEVPQDVAKRQQSSNSTQQ